ncbi:FecR family protein [Calditerrivibrio nitroreducens]|uniref:FecR protein n=1 Tax=Calditerrivibrio nitroreducens (strain DSM 19672 / NBRC 101217 / Yu37-1) TaxID=768670 RepID=E4TK23_CALNY|nr:FecR family protein [Calditerrivibrio nitroreducens]ADR19299.1 FecR protein [Calditerrivibrio nitroreducens DSM 19672]
MKNLIISIVLVLGICITGFAQQVAGHIEKFEGKVILYPSGSVRGIAAKNNLEFKVKDSIRAFQKSTAFIKFIDQSKIVLNENSILYVKDIQNLNLKNGKVVFEIQKQDDKQGIKIATKTAIIGVKGTKFLINVNKDEVDVILKEGEITVSAVKGEFKRYLQKEEEDFNKFVQDTKQDYEEYKKKVQEEFVEFVKEFTMKDEMAISIKGKEVRDIKDTKEFDDEFELLNKF